MLHLPKMSYPIRYLGRRRSSCSSLIPQLRWRRLRSSSAMARGGEGEELGVFSEYMERLRNYERIGVPRGAGTDSGDGFDLGRMRRLLRRLGDPHFQFKVKSLLCFFVFVFFFLSKNAWRIPHLWAMLKQPPQLLIILFFFI